MLRLTTHTMCVRVSVSVCVCVCVCVWHLKKIKTRVVRELFNYPDGELFCMVDISLH